MPSREVIVKLGDLLVVLAAGVWLGSILTFGISAGSTFATIRHLQPSLTDTTRPADAPDFADVLFDRGQPEFVAGEVVSGLTDRALLPISFAACGLLVIGVILAHVTGRRAPWVRYGLVLLSIAMTAGVVYATMMMGFAHFKMYEIAHSRHDPIEYQAHFRDIFDGYHVIAERLFGVIAIVQLAILAVTMLAARPNTHDLSTPKPGDATDG